jgi:RNA polymerase-binding transcription factor DksA
MNTVKKIKDLLMHQQKKVEEEIQLLDADDPVNSNDVAESSEPGTDSWVADTHTRTVAVKRGLQDMLIKIKHALKSLSSGKYGKCENCGKKIEDSRLTAMPTASLCISCSKLKK